MEKIKAYKAFDKGLLCRGFQYEVGKAYTHDGNISLCTQGFHACENPFDVLDFYDLATSEFCEVELSDEIKSDEKKSVSSKIEIKARLNLKGFIKAAIDFTWSKCEITDKGDNAKQASSGYNAQQEISGKFGVAISCGSNGKVKGIRGTLIALTWFVDGKPKDIIKGRIGWGGLKSNTWYRLDENGKFAEYQ